MKKTKRANHPALNQKAKKRLSELLLHSDPDCVIGIGIRIYLERNDLDSLIGELDHLIRTDQAYMKQVVGEEAIKIISS